MVLVSPIVDSRNCLDFQFPISQPAALLQSNFPTSGTSVLKLLCKGHYQHTLQFLIKPLSFSSAQVAQIDGFGYFLFYLARLSQM